jgi:NAD(P) transhydrogenase subunit beta
MDFRTFIIDLGYLVAAVLFIIGLKRMSVPRTARGGTLWAGWGMVLAVLITFLWPGLVSTNVVLIIAAIALGGTLAGYSGSKADLSDPPRMIALYIAMGGGAVGALAAGELMEAGRHGLTGTLLAVIGGLLGLVAAGGSLTCFAKLRGRTGRPVRFGSQNQVNATVLLSAVILGLMLLGGYPWHTQMAVAFLLFALLAGVMFTLPMDRAGLPVVICVYNALTGLAVTFQGFVLDNEAMIIAGTLVASAGTLLIQRMAGTSGESRGHGTSRRAAPGP